MASKTKDNVVAFTLINVEELERLRKIEKQLRQDHSKASNLTGYGYGELDNNVLRQNTIKYFSSKKGANNYYIPKISSAEDLDYGEPLATADLHASSEAHEEKQKSNKPWYHIGLRD